MSGYLRALMRSSGLTTTKSHASPGLELESTVEVPAQKAEPAQSLSTPAAQPERGSNIEAPGAIRAAAPAQPDRVGDEGMPRSAEYASTPVAAGIEATNHPQVTTMQEAPGTDAPARIETHVAPAKVAPARPVQGIDAVRAALRWVAADPGLARAKASPGRIEYADASPSRHLRSEVNLSSTPGDEGARTPDEVEHSAAPPAVAKDTKARQPLPARAIARPEPELVRERPRRSSPSAMTSDANAVEISIGAINVKVDPPPAKTVTPAPAPAARGPAPSRITPRSSLARRAMRRI